MQILLAPHHHFLPGLRGTLGTRRPDLRPACSDRWRTPARPRCAACPPRTRARSRWLFWSWQEKIIAKIAARKNYMYSKNLAKKNDCKVKILLRNLARKKTLVKILARKNYYGKNLSKKIIVKILTRKKNYGKNQ